MGIYRCTCLLLGCVIHWELVLAWFLARLHREWVKWSTQVAFGVLSCELDRQQGWAVITQPAGLTFSHAESLPVVLTDVFWRESRNTSWFPTPFSPFLFCFLRYYSWTAGKKNLKLVELWAERKFIFKSYVRMFFGQDREKWEELKRGRVEVKVETGWVGVGIACWKIIMNTNVRVTVFWKYLLEQSTFCSPRHSFCSLCWSLSSCLCFCRKSSILEHEWMYLHS